MVRGSTISKLISIVAGTYLWGAHAMAADGLTTIASNYGPEETMDRLEAEIKAKGITVFARIDHAAGAAQAGPSLRPTEVLLLGHATHAGRSDDGHRSAVEGAGLAGCRRQGLAVLQRAELAGDASRAGGRNQSDGRRHGGRPRRARKRGRRQAVTRGLWVARFAGKQAYEHRIP